MIRAATEGRDRQFRIAIVVAIPVLVVLLFGRSLALPVSFDDAWGMRLVRDLDFAELFTNTANFGYYRPLYLLYYKVGTLFGAAGGPVQHAAGICAQVANSLLLIALTRRLLADQASSGAERASAMRVAYVAGLLFAINPIAVQAVALPAGLNHLSALLFAQLATLVYIHLRNGASRRTALSMLFVMLAVLSFFSNEIGLSLAGFCFAYELLAAWRRGSWTRGSWSFMAVVGLCAVYAVLYFLIPKGNTVEFTFVIGEALERALYALQTLAYPAAFVLKAAAGSAAPALLVLAATGMLLLACAFASARREQRMALVLGLLLFAAGAALPVLRLPTYYVDNAPRVFYVASAGTAVVLAALVTMPNVLSIALAAAIAATSLLHVRSQLNLLEAAGEPVRAAADVALGMAEGERALALNFPEWAAYANKQFPLGKEGAIVLADYVGGYDLALANTGISRTIDLAQFTTPFQPAALLVGPWGERLEATALREALLSYEHVLLTEVVSDALRTRDIGGSAVRRPGPADAVFGGALELRGLHAAPCRDGYVVESRWRRAPGAAHGPQTVSMFAQVLDQKSAKLGQSDGAAMAGLLSFADVPADKDVVDRRYVRATAPADGGARLFAGLYDYQSGQRLTAIGPAGNRLEGDAVTLALPDPGFDVCR